MLRQINKPTKLSLALLLLAAIWLAGLQWFTRTIITDLPPAAEMPADAIVVLTGGSKRLDEGFALLEKKRGKKLFISGVYHGVEVKQLLDKLKKSSNLNCCVELGFEADDTQGNARETVKWLKEQKYTSFYLVTANYHMARAKLNFEAYGPDLTLIPYPVTPEGLDMQGWWRDPQYRDLILREYSKYLVTRLWSAFFVWGTLS
jgi:uncharacterized SAM-binding protein YcdF (DUF218 family)